MKVVINGIEYAPKISEKAIAAPYETLGDLLKACRVAMNMDRTQAALELGTNRQNLGTWEDNQCLPNLVNAAALCKLYGIPPDLFMALATQEK